MWFNLLLKSIGMFYTEASDSSQSPSTANATTSPAVSTVRFSAAAVVPAVTSVALLGGYATVEAFNTTEQARVVVCLLPLRSLLCLRLSSDARLLVTELRRCTTHSSECNGQAQCTTSVTPVDCTLFSF